MRRKNREEPERFEVTRRGRAVDLEGLWAPNPAFLVGSGPDLAKFDLERLKERGVLSFGINNAAAVAPCRAWCFSDPQSKFHYALFLDPAVMTFSPEPKLKRKIKIKLADGFHDTTVRVQDCPNTFGFRRSTMFDPEHFFDTPFAHWGNGKHQPEGIESAGCLATLFLGFRLLHYLGVRRVYLLGVDHKAGRNRYRKEQGAFERLLPVFAKHGLEVCNCNPESGCKVFPFVSFDEAVDDCKG